MLGFDNASLCSRVVSLLTSLTINTFQVASKVAAIHSGAVVTLSRLLSLPNTSQCLKGEENIDISFDIYSN